ncbi:helix-turn-helix domain-containing protein [Xanthobacter oligotrophicus]|uniref:helix-turn-helix domain-containing protein n=1 Tax=Xanthobacter oligotrophicus TaxID=2607286 RepID=UPI00165DBED5|nr:helix-turn-helix domain-containing protein [Xanthobacter oligotrophicus]MCG5237356.1 helix-turn-helix domain-containing protein [Xanthobacter oligotrophicus]
MGGSRTLRRREGHGSPAVGQVPDEARTASLLPPAGAGSGCVETLAAFVAGLPAAANDGNPRVFSEAESCFADLTSGTAEIVVNSAGLWRRWQQLDVPEEDPGPHVLSLAEAFPGRVVFPIRTGTIAVLLDDDGGPALKDALSLLAGCVALALDVGTGRTTVARSVSELDVMRAVAARILETRDLDEILLLVSHEAKRLLDADICGVMLCEGDQVVMKSCVGHISPTMPRLRMQSGVGVAGQVLATGEPCMVRNYVESDIITRDFVPLARVEKVRSALAVPILSRDSIIGVLEVWRRRPSVFNSGDTPLLLALAGLASIAIDNALLLRAHAEAAERLSIAYGELTERYSVITSAASFQEQIAGLMLVDHSLPKILDLTAEFTDATILFFDADRHLECAMPAAERPGEDQIAVLTGLLPKAKRVGDAPFSAPFEGRLAHVLPVTSGVETLGWLVWLGQVQPGERVRLALRHVSLAAGLYCFERRRIARERLGTLESVMWSLLEGELVDRTVAHDRARELRVHIRDSVFVAVIALPTNATAHSADLDPIRHERILAATEQYGLGALVLMAGIRGNQLCLICKGNPDAARSAALNGLLDRLKAELRVPAIPMGLSGLHSDWRSLPAAFREALVALEVARHRRSNPVARYGEIGIMGLLVNLRGKADMRRVGEEILGGLLSEPEPSRGVLLETLKAFFDCDCSQISTAARLHVHNKTVAYRLEKVGSLTGLNLARHQDRVLADIGIRLMTLLDDGA